jgi:signal transduction histidine kinase
MHRPSGVPTHGARDEAGRQQRLAEMGARLTEVGHEMKVPLSLIVGSLEHLDASVRASLAKTRDGGADEASSLLETLQTAAALVSVCRQGAARLERVTAELADYARGGLRSSGAGRVDLPRLLRTAADLVARSAPRSPAIVLDVPDLPPVCGEANTLERVFTNVLRNALDALANIRDATVHVRAVAREPLDALPRHVEVRVSDNGPGIPIADRARIFEPFFSRKGGAGLGLGLAIAREIVEANGGTIGIAPNVQSGSEFVIRLPVAP